MHVFTKIYNTTKFKCATICVVPIHLGNACKNIALYIAIYAFLMIFLCSWHVKKVSSTTLSQWGAWYICKILQYIAIYKSMIYYCAVVTAIGSQHLIILPDNGWNINIKAIIIINLSILAHKRQKYTMRSNCGSRWC